MLEGRRRAVEIAAARALPAAFVLAAALVLGGCLGSTGGGSAPAGAVTAVPAGSEEDFMINVGRRTYFTEGSAVLDSTAKVTLDKQAVWLAQYPNWPIKVQGFADDPGSEEQDVKLSQERADAVRAYLISKGVAPDRIWAKGYGRQRLVLDCPDISCKSQNRRAVTNLQDDPDV